MKDFYNLINVYLDSVLHPALTPWTLKQEGWHYDIEDAKEPLTYKAIAKRYAYFDEAGEQLECS